MTKPAVGIVIDYGELVAGLSAARGMANGFTKRKRTDTAIQRITKLAEQDFGRMTDARGEDELSHMYEYRGALTNDVIASPAGRLWELDHRKIQSGISVAVRFKQSTVPGGPEPELRKAFPKMASHRFPDKAKHLETNEMLTAVVGQQKFTERVGGTGREPKSLVFLSHGMIRFARYRNWRNRFYGKFTEHFEAYWRGQFVTGANSKLRTFTGKISRKLTTLGKTEVAMARTQSIPNPARAVPGRTTFLDRGRPFKGLKDDPAIVARVEKQVEEAVARELVKSWRT
ncbi:MAG: hypothetical protein LC650_00940 [Actinobacteria bacterium]|nr:hypothetical protein [Actinomycetota bacterium]